MGKSKADQALEAASYMLKYVNFVDAIILGLNLAPKVMELYHQNRDRILKIIKEQREPTPEEHAVLNGELNELLASLHKHSSKKDEA